MFRLPFQKRVPPPPPPMIPPGVRAYAIGDVHGRADLLDALLDDVFADHARRAPARLRLVFLGDLIDRGPGSRDVVERVRGLVLSDDRVSCIIGNHEEVFLLALDGDADALGMFLRIGGDATLASYGIVDEIYASGSDAELIDVMRARVPAEHVAFLSGLDDRVEIGGYLCVHAGVRPGIPLDAQQPTDLRWIRQPFLDHRGDFGKFIIHGHTPMGEVDVQPNRIGIDTGAAYGGKLTAIGLESMQRWFLSVG
ncbi:metallophosphoesterase [Sphingomonas sp. NFR15]|uniref:metallophosphoesterase n=1 Tax=Sphingomonas sp. NFR15 TaxID=1566282 RepID=UPI00088F5986|nr:metallophosphoesterase [Sphingomonas sp. NFR15]SDA21330.1 serine/threonine protein phosphatase 1 [Sphingomonas sp. NFR15]